MKTFQDLQFGPHPHGDGLIAVINFNNGYGVSVIRFRSPFKLGLMTVILMVGELD